MKIKDFSVGQTVYILEYKLNRRNESSVTAAEIAKVGRKYITISGHQDLQFEELAVDRPYLIKRVDYGSPRMLFPSNEAVDEYIERESLKKWLQTAVEWNKIDRYTLSQLRAVKQLLAPGE